MKTASGSWPLSSIILTVAGGTLVAWGCVSYCSDPFSCLRTSVT